MTISLAAVLMLAALRGRDDKRAILDGPRTQQHMPMRLAGLPGEGGRHGKYIGGS